MKERTFKSLQMIQKSSNHVKQSQGLFINFNRNLPKLSRLRFLSLVSVLSILSLTDTSFAFPGTVRSINNGHYFNAPDSESSRKDSPAWINKSEEVEVAFCRPPAKKIEVNADTDSKDNLCYVLGSQKRHILSPIWVYQSDLCNNRAEISIFQSCDPRNSHIIRAVTLIKFYCGAANTNSANNLSLYLLGENRYNENYHCKSYNTRN